MEELIAAMTRISGEFGRILRNDGPVVEEIDETPVLTMAGPKRNATLAAADMTTMLNSIPMIIQALRSKPEALESFVSVKDVKNLVGSEFAKLTASGTASQGFDSKGEMIKTIRDEIDMRMGEHLTKGHGFI